MTAMEAVATWTGQARSRIGASALTAHLVFLLVLTIWALNGVILKTGLEHVRPVSMTTARLLIAGLFMVGLATLRGHRIGSPPDLRILVPAALFGIVLNQVSFTYALHLSTVVDVQLIIGLGPVLTVLFFCI